jgi:hypothetical protein
MQKAHQVYRYFSCVNDFKIETKPTYLQMAKCEVACCCANSQTKEAAVGSLKIS